MGQLLLIKLVNIVHGKSVCGVGVHNDSVLRVNGEPRHMAHQMRGQLACKFSTVSVAPKQLGCGSVLCNADNAEVVFRVIFDVLKVFARSGDNEDFSNKCSRIKSGRNCSDNLVEVKIFSNLFFVKQIAYVSAVAFVPTESVHIGCGFFHLFHKWCSQDIFHFLSSKTVFSYSLTFER